MDDVRADILEQQRERDLLARTGRSRPIGNAGLPTRREYDAKCGPVTTIRPAVLPALPSMGARIEWLRKASGQTKAEMANSVHVHPSAVGFWERNRCKPRPGAAALLAKEYNAPLEWLTGSIKNEESSTAKPEEAQNTPSQARNYPQKPFLRHSLETCGNYTGSDLKTLLGGLVDSMPYEVDIKIKNVG